MSIRYANFYQEHKACKAMQILQAFLIMTFADIKRLVLCICFFYEGNCILLISTPIILQILSLPIIILCSSFKNKIIKSVCVVNEAFVLVFCACCIFNYPCNQLYSDISAKVIGMLMELSLIILLSIEGIIICSQNYYTIKKIAKSIKTKKIKPLNRSLDKSKSIDEESKLPDIRRRSKKKQSCGTDMKLFELRSELKVVKSKDNSMRLEDIENSLHNICDNSVIKKIVGGKESSNLVRLKQSRYGYEEANEEEIIPKIGIIEYDSVSSISKCRSNPSYMAPLRLDEKLSVCINLPYEITPKSVREQSNFLSDNLSSNGNHNEYILKSEVLYPSWRKKPANKDSEESHRLSRFSMNSARSQS